MVGSWSSKHVELCQPKVLVIPSWSFIAWYWGVPNMILVYVGTIDQCFSHWLYSNDLDDNLGSQLGVPPLIWNLTFPPGEHIADMISQFHVRNADVMVCPKCALCIPQIHQSCPYLGTIGNHWDGVALQCFRKWLAAKSIIRRELPGVYPSKMFFS